MANCQTGGMMIMLIGLMLMVGSVPVFRYLPRTSMVCTQVGAGAMAWLARIFGGIVCMLGLVTLLQH